MTPETIRALLAGITAGEWEIVPERDYGFNVVTDLIDPPTPVAEYAQRADAAFIAASPGIARYALERAKDNERLRTALEVIANSDVHQRQGAHAVAYAALAPQPAPTDGVELNP